jgi:phosphatidate cytidylyltransferase
VKRVLTAVILIPIVVLALFRAPLWLFALLVLGVALLAAREYFDIAEKTGFRPMRGWSYAILGCIFGWMYCEVSGAVYGNGLGFRILTGVMKAVVLASPFVLMAASLRRESLSQSLPDAAISFLAIPYLGMTLLTLVLIRESEFGAFFLLYLMLVVWSGDVAAYYVGRVIGRNKLAPRVSPGKTWEGAIASALGAIVVALLLFHYSRPIFHQLAMVGLCHQNLLQTRGAIDGTDINPWLVHPPAWLVISFGVCVNIAAQLGDLFESAIKRGAGVKDSGTLLPGHGGVLDRIDALLFALPVGFVFYAIMH